MSVREQADTRIQSLQVAMVYVLYPLNMERRLKARALNHLLCPILQSWKAGNVPLFKIASFFFLTRF